MVTESINSKIESLRGLLNTLIVSKDCSKGYLVKKSQELDELIVKSVRKMQFGKKVLGEELLKEFDIVVDKINRFENIYDSIRIVDPINKDILEIKKDELHKINFDCYKFFNKEGICENCISERACNSDDIITKFEYIQDKAFMITAVPISIQNKKLSLELFKDVTELFLQNGEQISELRMISSGENISEDIIKDEVTNLYNNRYIYERLPADLIKSSLSDEPISIMFLDLNSLEEISNKYGQVAFDKLLKQFACELRKEIDADIDWAARLGKKEFLIVLPDTHIVVANIIGERIRKNIEEKDFTIEDEQIHVKMNVSVQVIAGSTKMI